jgi:hypothetical protein
MDLTYEKIEELYDTDKNLSLSVLFEKFPDNKKDVLKFYRQKIDKETENSLTTQNDSVLLAIKSLVSASNEIKNVQSQNVEEALFREIEVCQQEIDKQKQLLSDAEVELSKVRENENSGQQSVENLKKEHEAEIEQLSAFYQSKMKGLGDEINAKIDAKIISLGDTSPSINAIEPKEPNDDLFFSLNGWPDFNALTQGDKIIPLATRLTSEQMSFQLMEDFLGGSTHKERLLLFINELSSTGLLIIAPEIKKPNESESDNVEKAKRLKLFKRIRSSLGI